MREPYLFYDEKISTDEPQPPSDHNVKWETYFHSPARLLTVFQIVPLR